MISINEIISSNYMIGEVYGPISDVMDHPPDIRHPDNKFRAMARLLGAVDRWEAG